MRNHVIGITIDNHVLVQQSLIEYSGKSNHHSPIQNTNGQMPSFDTDDHTFHLLTITFLIFHCYSSIVSLQQGFNLKISWPIYHSNSFLYAWDTIIHELHY